MATSTITQLFDLSGKVALVTGGSKGIGEAISRRLSEAGAAVLIADLDATAGEALAQELRQRERKAQFVRADASSAEDADKAVAQAVQLFGRLDVLVNNAGIFPFSPVLSTNEKLWDRVLDTNLKGPFFYAQAAAKAMQKTGGGSIVNVASIDGLHPTGALAHYDASKGGLIMLTRSLAFELAALGVRVNAISPGGINTPGAAVATSAMLPSGVPLDKVMESFSARIPMKRMGEPDEIACAALFLATPASSYVTGSNVVVDGGYLLA